MKLIAIIAGITLGLAAPFLRSAAIILGLAAVDVDAQPLGVGTELTSPLKRRTIMEAKPSAKPSAKTGLTVIAGADRDSPRLDRHDEQH